MTGGWPKKRLGDISSVSYGYTESATTEPVGPRFLRITDIQNDQVDWNNVPFCKIPDTDRERFQLASGDIVFARTGATTGKSFLIQNPPDAVFASYLIRLRIQSGELLPRYVTYFFQTPTYWQTIKEGSSGSAQGGFNASKVAALSIPLPPPAEQHRIVAILDEAFASIAAARANAEWNRKNAREVFESRLEWVFAQAFARDEVVALADLATDITDGDHLPPPKAEQGIPFITIGNIVKDARTIDFEHTFKVPQSYFDKLKPNRKPRQGDVLYTVTGSFGIPVLVAGERSFCFQRHIGLIRPKAGIDSQWLQHLLMSPQLYRQAEQGATGAAQKTVALKTLRGFKVPRTSLQRQKEDSETLCSLASETQHLESLYTRKLAALDELKQSLLQQAFSGAL